LNSHLRPSGFGAREEVAVEFSWLMFEFVYCLDGEFAGRAQEE